MTSSLTSNTYFKTEAKKERGRNTASYPKHLRSPYYKNFLFGCKSVRATRIKKLVCFRFVRYFLGDILKRNSPEKADLHLFLKRLLMKCDKKNHDNRFLEVLRKLPPPNESSFFRVMVHFPTILTCFLRLWTNK